MTNDVNISKEVENHEKLQRKILFIKSVALLLSILIALLGAVVAWFASNVSANGMLVNVRQPMVSGFTIGEGGYYTQSIELSCAIKISDYSDPAFLTNNGLMYIAEYRIKKATATTTSVYMKFFFPEGVEYIKVMYLGAKLTSQNISTLTSTQLGDWKTYLSDPEHYSGNKQDKGFCVTEPTGQLLKNISGTRKAYFAFFADYDAPYSRDSHGNVIKTLGEALKDGDIRQEDLCFDFEVRVKDGTDFTVQN